MAVKSPPAQVTGISPIEGVPGTKLTLRGEHFGQSALDLTHVFVGGIDVSPSARWFSPRKVSVITPLGVGELEIVLVTKSGGFGTSELTYSQHVDPKIGAQEQVSYWPEDERRRCPAIIERGSGARQEGGGDVVDASLAVTGLPTAELARLSGPISDTVLHKIYPHNGSVLLSESDFDPMLFLLKYYKNASFEDLVIARNNFSRSIAETGGHDSSNIIKNNLYLIFRCLEGLEDLRSEMKRSNIPGNYEYNANEVTGVFSPNEGEKVKSKAKEGTVETRLEKKLTDSWNQGHDLFKDVLRCREAANSARNVLNIMERFSFLFRLPESIRNTIKQGDYNMAINDYKRSKALFSSSDCEAFGRVFMEIETVVARFREALKAELLQAPIGVEKAMRIIKCLEQLDVGYDPYWVCAESFKNWLIEQVRGFQRRYQDVVELSASDAPASPSFAAMRPKPTSLLGKQQVTVQLVKQICDLLSTHCVQFWRLQSVCLAASAKSKPTILSDGQQSLQARYQTLNIELIHLLASCTREAVLQPAPIGSLETVTSGWATSCVQEFRDCCLSLPLDVVPRDAQSVLRRLSYDLRRHAVRDVLRSSRTLTESLHFKEKWDVEVTDNGGSITQLPLMYENVVAESLSRCRTLMSSRTSLENSLFDAPEYQERFAQSFTDVMLGFLNALQHLSQQIEQSLSRQDGTMDSAQYSIGDAVNGLTDRTHYQKPVVAQARGVLLLVSNADWAGREANARVASAYEAAGFAGASELRARVADAWAAATEGLVDLYVRIRTRWLCTPFEEDHTPDTALQSAIITALCNLSHIHAELVLILGASASANETGVNGAPGPDRIRSIMRAVAVKLSDSICTRSGDAVESSSDANVAFIIDLLKLLINGDPLERFLASKTVALNVKQSLRLVAKALDPRETFESLQNATESAESQPQRPLHRIIPRPHFRHQ